MYYKWCSGTDLNRVHLFQIHYSLPILTVFFTQEKNATILCQKSNSAFGHWFVFKHCVILAKLIDFGGITHNTKYSIALCLTKVNLSTHVCIVFANANPLSSYILTSTKWNSCKYGRMGTEARLYYKHNFKIFTVLPAGFSISCWMSFTHSSQTKKGLRKQAQKVKEAHTELRQFLVTQANSGVIIFLIKT